MEKKRCFEFIPIFLYLLVITALYSELFYAPTTFDANYWKNNANSRASMANDVLRHLTVGLTINETYNLLGPADPQQRSRHDFLKAALSSGTVVYPLGIDKRDNWRWDSLSLTIEFDKQGLLKSAYSHKG